MRSTRLLRTLFVLAALGAATAATAKDFAPGDLRVCNARRCAPIMNRKVLPTFSSFLYGGRRPVAVGAPRMGAPTFELRFTNDYTVGIVSTARLDRFLSYGVNLDRFRRGTWYRIPPAAALELRHLTKALKPLELTPARVRKSR